MLGLKADAYDINNSGDGQYAFFSDIGTRALQSVRVGEGAGKISQGSANTFIGFESGKENRAGSFGVFVGFQAGQLNQAGNLNTFVGSYAGRENNRGDANTFVGYQAGAVNRDGDECTGVGAFALRENTTGNRNVAVGNRAGERILDGDGNTMIGVEAGQDIRSGTNNTMSGFRSGRGSFRGNENTYFGAFSGYSNSLGDGNAFVGFKAGEYLTLGDFNVAVGAYALQRATSGSCNIAIGAFAGSILSGSGNVFVGTGAGSSNLSGDNNTNVGNNAGFEGNGSDNVYIGKNAAYSLDGNQNVVIGVGAMPDIQSTGSVVIGYKTGDTIFQRGNCNVFIGVGADAFIQDTSYAIAIGANQTRAYTHSISVGEEVTTAGVNAISLGYQLTTDSDQCVGVGNSITVNSAEIFNDPLNYRFPVSLTEAYNTFYLTENYTDTLFLNNTSNTIAIATIDNSNLYDSGNNTLKGSTQTQDIDLRSLFTNGLFFQGATLYPPSLIPELDTYLKDNLITLGFSKNSLTYVLTGPYNSSNNLPAAYLDLPFNSIGLGLLNVNCNLVPIDTDQYLFRIATPKRQALYQIETSNSDIIIRNTQSNEVEAESQLAAFSYYNYVWQPPQYGYVDSNLVYQPYPETLFNSNDRYILATVNELTNSHPQDTNVYGLVSENVYPQDYIRYPTPSYKQQPIIHMHPGYSNRFDPSYFFYLPASNISYFTLQSLDSNLQLSSSNYGDAPYLTLQDYTSNVTEPLRLSSSDASYDFTILYNCNVTQYTYSNLSFNVLPFSFSNYRVPLQPASNTLVYSYPKYGNIIVATNAITYQTTQINFGQDNFTLLLQNRPYQHTYYDITVTTSNLFRALPLHKMQEPIEITLINQATQISPAIIQSNVLFVSYSNIVSVTQTVSTPATNTPANSITTQSFPYTAPYLEQGYIQTSNQTEYFNYTQVNQDDPRLAGQGFPTANIIDPTLGNYADFILYYPYQPYIHYFYYNSNETTPYYQVTCNLTNVTKETPLNGRNFNLYYLLAKSYSNESYYFQTCNVTIFNSNLTIDTANIYDRYQNYIYTTTTSNPTPLSTSNFSLLLPSNDPRSVTINYDVTTLRSYNSNIPTVQLQDTLFYQPNAAYTVARPPTQPNLLVLQRNRGPVDNFHQSNISGGEVHIWNNQSVSEVVTSNIFFNGGRSAGVRYYPNSTTVLEGGGGPITYNNQVPTTGSYSFTNASEYFFIIIQHSSNISFRNANDEPITAYNWTTSTAFPVPNLSYSNDAFVDYINLRSDTEYRKPYRFIIPTTYLKNKPLHYNIAPRPDKTTLLTSNHIYSSPNETFTVGTLNTVQLFKNGTPLTTGNTFTQRDINEEQLTIAGSATDTFSLTTTGSTTYNLTVYAAPEFPPANTSGCNVLLQLKDSYQHYQLGALWDYLTYNNQNLPMTILQQPSLGFLATSNGDVIHTQTYQQLQDPSNRIYYIPYNSNVLANDQFVATFHYHDTVSPPYTLTLKNYWSRWSNIEVPVNNGVFYGLAPSGTFYTSNLPRSQGMQSDGLVWSPPSFTLPYNTESNVTLSLNYLNQSVTTDIRTRPLTQQPTFTTSSNTYQVDNTSYTYLDSLLPLTPGTMFYITQAPTQGVILTKITENQFQAYPYFSREDILNRKVFYHHYGVDLASATLTNDLFLLKTATTPFDLSTATLSNLVNLSEAPKLLVNNYDYIFYGTIAEGSNTYNPLTTNKLDISKGFLSVIAQSNLDLFIKDGTTYTPTTIITDEDLTNNKAYYRPSSNLFQDGINKNEPMTMQFTLSSNINNFEANPLSVYPQYQNLFSQTWFSKFNTYESVNVLQSSIASNQAISYTRFVNTTSNISFANKKCQFDFEYLPFQTDLVNPTYIDFIRTYYYSFELLNTSNQPLLKAEFTHSNVKVTASNVEVLYEAPTRPFDSVTWNSFSLVNFDSLNNNNLSLTLNGINYTYAQAVPSLDLTDLKQIRINVPIYEPINYYNVTQTSNIAPGTNVYYNLVNYNTQLRFRNFNIFLSTTEVDANIATGAADPNVYNIAIGNKLDVRGINNICLGQDFRTTGKNSIILGSSIGVQQGAEVILNEIFNSIVISNNSFTNSKVRDVIAIGNNILNDITGNIEDFLSKKPVLVGNNIDSSKIDFHVNFQNTFLKTTVPTPQIYCGLENEHVCIGYTSNEQIDNAKRLHVKGGAEVFGPWEIIHGGQRVLRTVVGNLLFTTGTSHSYSIVLSWTNPQSTDYNAFSLAGKFRVVNNDTSYAYRRFEVFITPKNDSLNNKPSALSDLEIASFSTTDITGLDHSIVRVNATTVQLVISWNTEDALSLVNYGQGTLELEVSAPVALGEISIV